MNECRDCGHKEIAGALFCSECGASLLELGGELAVLESPKAPAPPSLVGQGTESLSGKTEIILMIPYSGRRVSFPIDAEIRIGRSNPGQEDPPELNLMSDAGIEHGVSRRHAVIRAVADGLAVTDLNSTNGTTLNNFRIPPDLPYPLKSGDEIHFGSLLVHVFLK